MIGIIDSGFGGLSAVAEIFRQKRRVPFVYLGDNYNVPYGIKNQEEITYLSCRMIDYLITHYEIDTLIIACNTIVAAALPQIVQKYPQLVIEDVVSHGAIAAKMTMSNQVCVLATDFTVRSHIYTKKITDFATNVDVCEISAQPWVKIIEEGSLITNDILMPILDKIKPNTDILILGCTHFPFLYRAIRAKLPETITIVDPAISCITQLDYLDCDNWLEKTVFLTSGAAEDFACFVSERRLDQFEIPIKQIKW